MKNREALFFLEWGYLQIANFINLMGGGVREVIC